MTGKSLQTIRAAGIDCRGRREAARRHRPPVSAATAAFLALSLATIAGCGNATRVPVTGKVVLDG